MGSSKFNYIIGLVSGVALAVLLYAFVLAPMGNGAIPPSSGISAATSIDNQSDGLDLLLVQEKLAHINRLIGDHFIGDFDMDLAIDLMFRGFVSGAGDPYTSYMDAEGYAAFVERAQGEFSGIGVTVTVDTNDNRILVISPHEGSPAFEAGIIPGDKIVRVEGAEVTGDTLNEAISMIRGEIGTSVTITILRESEDRLIDFTIVRDIVQIETVRASMLENNIGYIRLSGFDMLTFEQFSSAYNRLVSQNMEGLIIDVRNNPGGLMDAVVNIADLLIPEGVITYTEDAHGRRQYHRSGAGQIEVPLLILQNGNSASASEVLAGAVRDSGVGELVGTTSFGKGVVQSIFRLPDESAVRITVARYYSPNGISIDGEGFAPEHYIEMDAALTNNLIQLALEEDIQLLETIRIMNTKIRGQ
ncbi:MAG: S41 family peptidase [Defluviitaleaceae bacterium]|nr:S41 family peptidase [Defluviitaleaceae bacterium]